MKLSESLKKFLSDLKNDLPDFEDADFSHINWRTHEGQSALHIAVMRNDHAIAEELIAQGIDVNARGDLGHTPLHEAAAMADMAMVKLLVASGADVHSLTEGDPPLTLARYANKHDICAYLMEVMDDIHTADRSVWARQQIAYLQREILRIQQQYDV